MAPEAYPARAGDQGNGTNPMPQQARWNPTTESPRVLTHLRRESRHAPLTEILGRPAVRLSGVGVGAPKRIQGIMSLTPRGVSGGVSSARNAGANQAQQPR